MTPAALTASSPLQTSGRSARGQDNAAHDAPPFDAVLADVADSASPSAPPATAGVKTTLVAMTPIQIVASPNDSTPPAAASVGTVASPVASDKTVGTHPGSPAHDTAAQGVRALLEQIGRQAANPAPRLVAVPVASDAPRPASAHDTMASAEPASDTPQVDDKLATTDDAAQVAGQDAAPATSASIAVPVQLMTGAMSFAPTSPPVAPSSTPETISAAPAGRSTGKVETSTIPIPRDALPAADAAPPPVEIGTVELRSYLAPAPGPAAMTNAATPGSPAVTSTISPSPSAGDTDGTAAGAGATPASTAALVLNTRKTAPATAAEDARTPAAADAPPAAPSHVAASADAVPAAAAATVPASPRAAPSYTPAAGNPLRAVAKPVPAKSPPANSSPAAPAVSAATERGDRSSPDTIDHATSASPVVDAAPEIAAIEPRGTPVADTAQVTPQSSAIGPSIQTIARAVAGLAPAEDSRAAASPAEPTPARTPASARSMTLQLTPANLGTVTVHLHLSGGGLDVRLSVADPKTLGLISHERDTLTTAIGDQTARLNSLVIQGADATSPQPAGSHDSVRSNGGDPRADQTSSSGGANSGDDRPRQSTRDDNAPPRGARSPGGRASNPIDDGLFV